MLARTITLVSYMVCSGIKFGLKPIQISIITDPHGDEESQTIFATQTEPILRCNFPILDKINKYDDEKKNKIK